jgi:hypothetical protein
MRPDQVQQRAGGGRECPPRLAQPPAGGGPSGRDARAPEFHQRQSGLDQAYQADNYAVMGLTG